MHASDSEVVVVVVSQHYTADHDCDDTGHIEKLCHDVAQNTKNVSKCYLGDLTFH